MKKKILISIGTRPEVIKTAILIKRLKRDDCFDVVVVSTGQHKSMLDEMLTFFDIIPDYKLDIMKENQSLTYLSGTLLSEMEKILQEEKPHLMVVQGDTTTAFISALVSFYHKIPVAHIEAGLRTNDIYQPFPEEINREFIDRISEMLFAPTLENYNNLIKENISKEKIFITGNTVIDALNYIKKDKTKTQKDIVLITAHRRENFGKGIENIAMAIRELADKFEDLRFIYPVHKNPNIQKPVFEILSSIKNVELISPLSYMDFISLLLTAKLVLTDSGGVQEEATSLGIPTIVLRNITERSEGVDAHILKPVGTDKAKIIAAAKEFLKNDYKEYTPADVYGNGNASKKIVEIIKERLRCSKQR